MNCIINSKLKINNKSTIIEIISLCYPILNLFVARSTKFNIIYFNRNIEMIKSLIKIKSGLLTVKKHQFNLKKPYLTNICQYLKKSDFITAFSILLNKYKNATPQYIKNTGKEIRKILKKGQLVILKSITYPKTTNHFLCLKENTDLKVITNFKLFYYLKRANQDNNKYIIENMPNIGDSSHTPIEVITSFEIALM